MAEGGVRCGAGLSVGTTATQKQMQVVGNGYDYVAQVPAGRLLTLAAGSFPKVTGVKPKRASALPRLAMAGFLEPMNTRCR